MNRWKADLALFAAALIWGTAFVTQKIANEVMPPLLFVGCRFLLSALMLAPLAWFERRKRTERLTAGDWRLGFIIGLCLLISVSIQQIGMLTSSATNAAFLTVLYAAMVPFAAWLIERTRPTRAILAAVAISLVGAWLLEGGGGEWSRGDALVLSADIFFALQIIFVARFLNRRSRPFLLSFLQFAVTGLGALAVSLAVEPFAIEGIQRAAAAILYAGLLSGGVGFTLQIVAQSHTPAAEAAIIMSLECVVAALAGAWMLGDRLSLSGIAGCVLILAGVLLVQIAPLLRRLELERK